MGSRRLTKECVYCGSREQLSKDHVPGRGLFIHPLPSTTNLLTVPCCESCKAANDLEDEYFRLHVAAGFQSRTVPSARHASGRAFGRLEHPKSAGLRRSFIDSILEFKPLEGEGESGSAVKVNVNFSRFNAYAVRTLKALFAHQSGKRVPNEASILAVCLDMLPLLPAGMDQRLLRISAFLQDATVHEFPQDVLRYKFAWVSDDGVSSLWELEFFRGTRYVGAIGAQRSVA